MTGPFTTITVDQFYAMQDRIRALEKVIREAIDVIHGEFCGERCHSAHLEIETALERK